MSCRPRNNGYRENQERLEMLAEFRPASPEQYRRWNLEDRLAQIDAAERALTNGCGMFERHCHLATLAGRTPYQARADARALYAEAV